ncbi:unnamed protein product [Phytomonas sp. EM1]|nr:unnamed protein product [Phytomonas sp. EM1]|eukprot:CCW62822.1 unnamed protein product [Phytomonas sp. isolate EM1]
MLKDKQWRATANIELLLNDVYPPARIEREFVSQQLPKVVTTRDLKASIPSNNSGALVDAHSVVSFHKMTYCSTQDMNAPSVRRILVKYYQHLLRRIFIRSSPFLYPTKLEEGDLDDIKMEPSDEDVGEEPNGIPQGSPQPVDFAPTPGRRPTGSEGKRAYRALGILTQVHDVVGAQALQPWEFFVIQDLEDEAAYLPVLRALKKDIAPGPFSLLLNGTTSRDPTSAAAGLANGGGGEGGAGKGDGPPPSLNWGDDAEQAAVAFEGQRLSLFPRLLPAFTGVYPGMAVGIVGEPHQRDARGVLTGVLLWDLVLPHPPMLPWRVDRPLPHAERGGSAITTAAAVPTRVQFCCGPFPRGDIIGLLRAVTLQALFRAADVLIIGGPLVKPFEDSEKDRMPHMVETFENMLFSYVDAVEGCMNEYYASRPNLPHLKVVMIPHCDDVMQVPVLPKVTYALEDTEDIYFRSNPCRLSVNGVHFGVCNEDVVGVMRNVMVERWPTPEGSLRRVVETLIQSRWYTPIVELPATQVDMKYLDKMRIDYLPEEDALPDTGNPPSQQNEEVEAEFPRVQTETNWNRFRFIGPDDEGLHTAPISGDPPVLKRAKPEEGLVKVENDDEGAPPPSVAREDVRKGEGEGEGVEYMPHVVFAPSTRPQFAVVTHQGVRDGAHATVLVEGPLDDPTTASGVLVVNPGVWSRRVSRQFTLRVAEVTIPDSALVLSRGASVNTGVACGLLHIFNPEES